MTVTTGLSLVDVARARLDRIRACWDQLDAEYAQAVIARDWQTLGYADVETWRAASIGTRRFSPDARKRIVAALSEAGRTVREIAAATGASSATVNRDQQEQPRVSNETRRQCGARQGNLTRKAPAPVSLPPRISEAEAIRERRERYNRWAADPHNRYLAADGWLETIANALDSLAAEDVNRLSIPDARALRSKGAMLADQISRWVTSVKDGHAVDA